MEKYLTKRTTLIVIGLLTLWRLYIAATLQLHQDEAYYWLWSKHLAGGYFDHAPMVAYWIKLTTLFSNGELWVRLSGIISSVLGSVLAWLMAMQMFGNPAVAASSVLLLNIMPLTMSGSLLITPDIPAFFFTSLSIYLFWQIVRTGKPRFWYLTGIAFGLALLSKYTAVLIAPCFALFLAVTDERKWLKSVHPYAALALGLAMFLPVVLWNAGHEWISFKFQFGHGLGGTHYSPGQFLEYFGGQMLIAGPVLFAAGFYAAVAYLFRKDKRKLFLSLMSLPILLFFAYSSLKKSAGPNWPASAYFTFSILASVYLVGEKALRTKLWITAAALSFCMSLVATLHARFNVIPLAKMNQEWAKADATQFFYGWKEIADFIRRDYPDAKFVIVPSHTIPAEVQYYSGDKLFSYVDLRRTRPSQYNLWKFPDDLRDADGLYIDVVEGTLGNSYEKALGTVKDMTFLPVYRDGFPIRTYRVVYGKGFIQ